MKSKCTKSYWQKLESLPKSIQDAAKKQYKLWKKDTYHPSLEFKKPKGYRKTNVRSARVTDNYRALCILENDTAIWFWIGSHAEYDALLHRKKTLKTIKKPSI